MLGIRIVWLAGSGGLGSTVKNGGMVRLLIRGLVSLGFALGLMFEPVGTVSGSMLMVRVVMLDHIGDIAGYARNP